MTPRVPEMLPDSRRLFPRNITAGKRRRNRGKTTRSPAAWKSSCGAGFSLRGTLVPLVRWRTEVRGLSGGRLKPAPPGLASIPAVKALTRGPRGGPPRRSAKSLGFPVASTAPKRGTQLAARKFTAVSSQRSALWPPLVPRPQDQLARRSKHSPAKALPREHLCERFHAVRYLARGGANAAESSRPAKIPMFSDTTRCAQAHSSQLSAVSFLAATSSRRREWSGIVAAHKDSDV
jgi:hypothetical protein